MNISIKKEEKKDYKGIYKVNKLAFGQENESQLVEKIRKGDKFIPELSLVAEASGRVVGHILFSEIKISGSSVFKTLMLAPMAVAPEFQRQGIGTKLIKRGMELASELGYDSIIVVGHKEYYPGFGFKKASSWNIKFPFKVPDEAFMAVELAGGALEGKSGTVIYPDEFKEE
ncbi:MAG: N-acetyltransferase [Actinomycetota bacterium]|nr:N-acetyltransferase [Actinomycetota bacterium]